jgi:SAM-dependent methyltransferase
MQETNVLDQMRADWNKRASEDANYYVAFGRRDQDDEEFFATASDVVRALEAELKRVRGREAALEIGCGPGRLMRPLSRHFTEIHGVDVSDEMIRLAAERLRDLPNAHPRHNSGSDLAIFPDDKFDFIYSYAVFQHIPSPDVVFQYLREARRVLKPGGILRCQLNGLPAQAKTYDTWHGVRIAPEELAAFTREHDLQLLALEQTGTQYMWMTCRKRPAGWSASLAGRPPMLLSRIRGVSNALTGESVAPVSGAMAALSLWVAGLPEDCDLNHAAVLADGRACRVTYLGEMEKDGVSQVNATLPDGLRTGLVPVDLLWLGHPIAPSGWVRLMPAGPSVPRVISITDGVNLLSGARIVTRAVKVTMADVADASAFAATVDGVPAPGIDSFCVDPRTRGYEFNFRLPDRILAGPHEVQVKLGKRSFPALRIEVA